MDLYLYEINNDPGGECWPEDVTCEAVWAETAEDAKRLYRERHGGDPSDPLGITAVSPDRLSQIREYGAPGMPGIEGRLPLLRQLGWGCEGDESCEACGLHDFDLEQYTVCRECGQCRECGHADDCPEVCGEVG